MALYRDRLEAAHELARLLLSIKSEDPIVLGLRDGAVPIADVVARGLDAPFDVMIIEHLRDPRTGRRPAGAIDEHGRITLLDPAARWHHGETLCLIEPAREVFRKLRRERSRIRAILPELDVADRTVILVGQGLITGAKMLGAIAAIRDRGARKIVVAEPAGASAPSARVNQAADFVVMPHRDIEARDVAEIFEIAPPVTEDDIKAIVQRWAKSRGRHRKGIKTLAMKLYNDLGQMLACEADLAHTVTPGSGPYPAVICAHNLESDGRSPRTVAISRRLARRGVVAVRPDFTGHGNSEGELDDATPDRMYNDLKIVLNTVRDLREVHNRCIGLIGSGSGALVALKMMCDVADLRAAVIRGPMGGEELDVVMHLNAPTLLIYSEQEHRFAELRRRKEGDLPRIHRHLEIPGGTHLYNDPISLETMVSASVDWMLDHLFPTEPASSESGSPIAVTDTTGSSSGLHLRS